MSAQERAKALFMSGIAHIEREDWRAAAKDLRASLELAPGRPSTLDNLSVCLMNLDQLAEAEAVCRESLSVDDRSATPWHNLGLVQRLMDKPNDAIVSLRKSIELDGAFPDSWHYSGMLLAQLKRHPEALSCFETVLRLAGDHVEAMCLLSLSLSELQFHFAAFAVLEKAMLLAPDNALPYGAMGRLHLERKEREKAVVCFRAALERNPLDREMIEYSLSALTGEHLPTTAPKDYVANLFDGYAERFESHLVEKLAYRTPHVLLAHMQPYMGAAEGASLEIMDLGCGTGLMGTLVKERAKKLVGLDLSRRMLDEAAKKEIYDHLIWGEVDDVLASRDDTYDIVIAADVFVYIGDLSKTFRHAGARLRSGGLFAFSVEAFNGEGFHLNPSMRYSHSADYIRQLAESNGFAIRTLASDILRLEASAPDGKMMGYYAVLQKL